MSTPTPSPIAGRTVSRSARAAEDFAAADAYGAFTAALAPDAPVDPAFPFLTVDDLRRANSRCFQYFFSRDALRFFSSRVHGAVYGGGVFVTSERDEIAGQPRRYTVRAALPSGVVETVGDFQAFATSATAHRFAVEVGKLYAAHFAPVVERVEAERAEQNARYRARIAERLAARQD